jgi:RNA polymerase sigma-70 factor (ECF subfamily)
MIASTPAAPGEVHRRHLLAVIESRDSAAFIALFTYFAPRVKAYMKKRGAPDEIAEELAQDAMFILWRKAETYDPAKSAVSSWIFTIARNLRIDAVRRDRRRLFDPDDPQLAPAPAPAPDEELDSCEQHQRIRAALALLPPEQLAVVTLAFFQGKAHGEIAAALTLPLGTVKSRMRLAFQRLRAALAEEPPTPAPAERVAA